MAQIATALPLRRPTGDRRGDAAGAAGHACYTAAGTRERWRLSLHTLSVRAQEMDPGETLDCFAARAMTRLELSRASL